MLIVVKLIMQPNIIQIHQIYYSSETIYIFQELLTAGDLFSYFTRNHCYLPDTEISVIIRQVLLGVEYLHARKIVHRDVKLENILMASLTPGARVVIADFGSATTLKRMQSNGEPRRMTSFAGTHNYAAPSVLRCLVSSV